MSASAGLDAARVAPIAVFAFNRLQHFMRTIKALAACPEAPYTSLTIYCDGARSPQEMQAVTAVRAYASTIEDFASLRVDASETNRGLAASIVRGVTDQLTRSDRVVVLEDDLVVSPHFLRYMNQGLQCYAEDSQVASIHGYTYPTGQTLPETFFLRGADCWGWATWGRAWKHFDPDGQSLLDELRRRRLTRLFDLDGAYPYTRMLQDQIAGRNNSWAIRWHASCFLKDMLTLYPSQSLVLNIGNDESGTHSAASTHFDVKVSERPIDVRRIALVESSMASRAVSRFFKRQRRPLRQLVVRVRGRIGRLARHIGVLRSIERAQ